MKKGVYGGRKEGRGDREAEQGKWLGKRMMNRGENRKGRGLKTESRRLGRRRESMAVGRKGDDRGREAEGV